VDPITAFAACKAAYSTIQGAISVYKELKATGSDLADVTTEVGGALSSFFKGQQGVEEHYEAQKVQAEKDRAAGKKRNVTQDAIDNVIRMRQVKRFYKDLEHMVRWELGMPDLWNEIEVERERLLEEEREQRERERIERQQAQWRRKAILDAIQDKAVAATLVAVILGYASLLTLTIWLHRQNALPSWLRS
jgi:hypothetical protein